MSSNKKGFTLIELLIVVVIIGILAAIAIPSFLNQKSKASDAAAKTQVRTGQTAAETYSTDNNGEYLNMTTALLQKIEPTLNDATSATFTSVAATATTYEIKSVSVATKDEFVIKRLANGEVERLCTSPTSKTGCKGVEKSSW